MAAERSEMIGYAAFEVGLNNQKMALLGLFDRARRTGHPLVLPDLALFDPGRGLHGRMALDQVFPIEPLYRFARAHAIAIADAAPVETTAAFECFVRGSELITAAGRAGMAALDGFAAQFAMALRPHLAVSPVLERLKEEVFRTRGVGLVVQLRVEKDWEAYARGTLDNVVGEGEDYKLGFLEIFDKISTTLPAVRDAYVVCDESDLPVGKEDIRAAIRERHDIGLVWKSDLLTPDEIAPLSLFEQSILDFEMAMAGPGFVGMSRSTFANMVCFETFGRRRSPTRQHFIYNRPGLRLGQRWDNGAAVLPEQVCDPLSAHLPLVPPHHADVALPIRLIAHISDHGDVMVEAGRVGGAYFGPICCGLRQAGARLVEGIALTSKVPELRLSYRVRLADGRWSEWCAEGVYAGTRGLGQAITGVSLRLDGPLSLSYSAILVASFAGRPDLVFGTDGAECVTDEGRAVEALQIIFRRR